MAHNDFALGHTVLLDDVGRKVPQATRKRAVRRGPSTITTADLKTSERNKSDDTPELRLLTYNYLPDYISSDHRPVFARFCARVPTSWFQLPIHFIQPLSDGRSTIHSLLHHPSVFLEFFFLCILLFVIFPNISLNRKIL